MSAAGVSSAAAGTAGDTSRMVRTLSVSKRCVLMKLCVNETFLCYVAHTSEKAKPQSVPYEFGQVELTKLAAEYGVRLWMCLCEAIARSVQGRGLASLIEFQGVFLRSR